MKMRKKIKGESRLTAVEDGGQFSVGRKAVVSIGRFSVIKLLSFIFLFTLISSIFFSLPAHSQGIPFFRNYLPEDYHANSINFDIDTDSEGNVFIANFEGMMYFDHAQWRILRTPDIARVTVAYRAKDGTIWVGGYNYFGRVQGKDNGDIYLQRVGQPNLFNGEISEIYERNGKIRFIAMDGNIFELEGDNVRLIKKIAKESQLIAMLDVIDVDAAERGETNIIKSNIILEEPLGNGLKAIIKKGAGLIIADDNGKELYTLNTENGLSSNDVVYISHDGRGTLWGATSKGLFAMSIPSAFSRFSSYEGLLGSILSIETIGDRFYIGTDDGLFRQEGLRFVQVRGVTHACWALSKNGNGLLAATADGVFQIFPDGSAKQLTNQNTLSVIENGSDFYTGELDGIYLISADGSTRKKVSPMESVNKMIRDDQGTIWMASIYGMICSVRPGSETFSNYQKGHAEDMHTIVNINGKVEVFDAETTKPFPYPYISYTDDQGVCWLTNNEGKQLYCWKDGKPLKDFKLLLAPFSDHVIRAVYRRGDELWIGSDKGLSIVNTKAYDPYLNLKPDLRIRSITLGSDSILWGGFGEMPEVLPNLKSNEHNLHFTFSLRSPSIIGEDLYRYRLNNGVWSTWSTNTEASFVNLSHGDYTFHVQAKDAMNRLSDIASIKFKIEMPFYLRWYMNLVYLLFLMGILYLLFRLRLRKLEKDKLRLEKVIQDRSAEVVRLEKMATVGKLTQGLIDRILNPLNYINNFAKLSEGLIKDAKANIEDEKEHMDGENYDDTIDVLDMLSGNLQKVSEHGQNTTRTLKAMEEMLKDRSGGIVMMDIISVIRQNEEMLQAYYKEDIAKYGIKTTFDYPEGPFPIDGNPDQLSKTIMSLLGNAIYAIKKKIQRAQDTQYSPEITLRLTTDSKQVLISIRDNGIGIEDTIIDKIFDPFFTTKTTGEASGVGLYLSREIIQNHGGDISVKSVKDEYCEFTFNIPLK